MSPAEHVFVVSMLLWSVAAQWALVRLQRRAAVASAASRAARDRTRSRLTGSGGPRRPPRTDD